MNSVDVRLCILQPLLVYHPSLFLSLNFRLILPFYIRNHFNGVTAIKCYIGNKGQWVIALLWTIFEHVVSQLKWIVNGELSSHTRAKRAQLRFSAVRETP